MKQYKIVIFLKTIGNRINLENNRILLNRDVVQKENNIPLSLKTDNLDFSIEMETGTGKTYTYFRTIFELNILFQNILIPTAHPIRPK